MCGQFGCSSFAFSLLCVNRNLWAIFFSSFFVFVDVVSVIAVDVVGLRGRFNNIYLIFTVFWISRCLWFHLQCRNVSSWIFWLISNDKLCDNLLCVREQSKVYDYVFYIEITHISTRHHTNDFTIIIKTLVNSWLLWVNEKCTRQWASECMWEFRTLWTKPKNEREEEGEGQGQANGMAAYCAASEWDREWWAMGMRL